MSAYRGRTGPNFSQYLTDLNTLSPPEQPPFIEDDTFSNDLAMFTNTDFTNIDIPGYGDDGFNYDMPPEVHGQEDLKYEELLSGGSVPSTNFPSLPRLNTTAQVPPFYSAYSTPIQPAPISGFPVVETIRQDSASSDNKRARADSVDESADPEDKSRLAADEDKRRRNTAASARFRVKKKQREQALERTLKDTNEKNAKLEARISQLEMENKWLKDLITEKNGLQSKEEMAAAYEKHRIESEDRELKQEPGHTNGIGTA